MDQRRQKLVELRDGFDGAAHVETDRYAVTVWRHARDSVDAILAGWDEDAKVMPRDLPTTPASVAGEVYTNCSHCDRETMIGWASKEVWRKGFDAYNPEDER